MQPTWEHMLNHETRWMTRRELVDATYDAAERLNEIKRRHGRIPAREARSVAARIAAARALRARLDAGDGAPGSPASQKLAGDVRRFSESTVCDKGELFWQRHIVNFRIGELARLALAYALRPRHRP